MDQSVSTYLYAERSEPRRRWIRNDAALYVLLLLGAIGCYVLSRWLSLRFGTMRIVFQLVLYALLLGGGYAVYRFRLVDYQYTLTDRELIVEQIVGRKSTILCTVCIQDIIGLEVPQRSDVIDGRTYVGKRRNALCIRYRIDDAVHALYLSTSDVLRGYIGEQVTRIHKTDERANDGEKPLDDPMQKGEQAK